MDQHTLSNLLAASKPFLGIEGASRRAWRRNVQQGSRMGPWRYEAKYQVLNEACWSRTGAVIYFVADKTGSLRLVPELKAAILCHPEFQAFNAKATQRFADWRAAATKRLQAFDAGDHPKALIETLAEELLAVNDYRHA